VRNSGTHVVTARRGQIVAIDQVYLPSLFPIFGLVPAPPR
jgi:hypothetical protein